MKVTKFAFTLIFLIVASFFAVLNLNFKSRIAGYHLGDISYTLLVFLIWLLGLQKLKLGLFFSWGLTILTMLGLEGLQFFKTGQLVSENGGRLGRFIGAYVIGSDFDLLEISIYLVTASSFYFIIWFLQTSGWLIFPERKSGEVA